MNNHTESILRRIVKPGNGDVEAVIIKNDVVVFPLSGSIAIFYNGIKTSVNAGEILLLNKGIHQLEFCDCELLMFQLPMAEIERIILYLSTNYDIDIYTDHCCDTCRFRNFFVTKSTASLSEFFSSTNRFLDIDAFDEQNRRLKLTELIFLIFSSGNNCLKYRLLRTINGCSSRFSQAIYSQVFDPATLLEMANNCSVSTSTFKREFSRRFNTSPHKWSANQRLDRAQILLQTTSRPISEIAALCAYTNLSHFCKTFKQHNNLTPTQYRKKYKIK